eukprot:CAMPEP_0170751294 /NCGR_PEP_ID=MMETSP0437-20130122/11377_1 /TAXON_ID=0 /ORGANISM="Sexangularia sp." /LENGTH=853 /DNA_ID=CAMNT_0011090325 /DNA_START=63 /DNA_END=2621 /DNA_ORIENTATION=-
MSDPGTMALLTTRSLVEPPLCLSHLTRTDPFTTSTNSLSCLPTLPLDTSYTFSLAIPASFISTEMDQEEPPVEDDPPPTGKADAGAHDERPASWFSLFPPARFMPKQHPTWSLMPDGGLQRDRLALVGGGVGADGRVLSEADTRFLNLKTSAARTTRIGSKYQVDTLPQPSVSTSSRSKEVVPKSIMKRVAPVVPLDALPPPASHRSSTVVAIPRGGVCVWSPLRSNVTAARKVMARTAHAARAPGAGPTVERESSVLAALTAAQYDVEAALALLSPQEVEKKVQDAFPSPLAGSNTPFAATAETRARAWLRPHRVSSHECFADSFPLVEPSPADLWSAHTHQAFLAALRTHGNDLRAVARSMDAGVAVVDVVDAYYRWRLHPSVTAVLGPFETTDRSEPYQASAEVLEAAASSRLAATSAAESALTQPAPTHPAMWLPTVDDAQPVVLHPEPILSFDNDAPSDFPKAIGFDEPGAQAGAEAQNTRHFFDELHEALVEAVQRRKNKAVLTASSSSAPNALMRMGTNSTKAPPSAQGDQPVEPIPVRAAAVNAADSMEIAAALQDGFYFTSSDEDAGAMETSSEEEDWRSAGKKRTAARSKSKHANTVAKRAKTATGTAKSTSKSSSKRTASNVGAAKKKPTKKTVSTSTSSPAGGDASLAANVDATPVERSPGESAAPPKATAKAAKTASSKAAKRTAEGTKTNSRKSSTASTTSKAKTSSTTKKTSSAKSKVKAATRTKADAEDVTAAVDAAAADEDSKARKSKPKRSYYVVPENELPYLAHRPGGMDTPPPNEPGKVLSVGDRVAAWYSIAGWCNATVIDQRLGRSVKDHEYLVRYDMDESEYWVTLCETV